MLTPVVVEHRLKRALAALTPALFTIFSRDAVKQRCFLRHDKTVLIRSVFRQLQVARFAKNAFQDLDELTQILELHGDKPEEPLLPVQQVKLKQNSISKIKEPSPEETNAKENAFNLLMQHEINFFEYVDLLLQYFLRVFLLIAEARRAQQVRADRETDQAGLPAARRDEPGNCPSRPISALSALHQEGPRPRRLSQGQGAQAA